MKCGGEAGANDVWWVSVGFTACTPHCDNALSRVLGCLPNTAIYQHPCRRPPSHVHHALMPPIRVAQHARPAPVEPHHAFAFPKDHHLVITTETNVWSWDHRGLTNAFSSASAGILAAKEAKDGSGLLAVADDQVVVLHDANRGMNRSYRLKGTDVPRRDSPATASIVADAVLPGPSTSARVLQRLQEPVLHHHPSKRRPVLLVAPSHPA